MIININNENYELSTKLGTTFKIQKAFKKPYLKVLTNIEDMMAEEQIKMLSCGLNTQEEVSDFTKACEDIGIGELSDYLEQFIDELQYPGLSEEEREQKKLKKLEKQKHMREIGLIN